MLGMDPRSPPGAACAAAAGRAPEAWARAAVISSEVMCTCAAEGLGEAAEGAGCDSRGLLASSCATGVEESAGWALGGGSSSCAIFSWNDCALAAAWAGVCWVTTGAGRFSTSTRATTDVTSVATLMMRSSFHFFMAAFGPQAMLPGRRPGPQVTEVTLRRVTEVGVGPGVCHGLPHSL